MLAMTISSGSAIDIILVFILGLLIYSDIKLMREPRFEDFEEAKTVRVKRKPKQIIEQSIQVTSRLQSVE